MGNPQGGGDDRLRICLLGDQTVELGGVRLSGFDAPRLRSLLALLIVHRDRPQSRAQVAFTLWPDSSEGQARTNLRQLIFDLRRAIPDTERFVEIDRQSMCWRPTDPGAVEIDIVTLENGAESTSPETLRRAAATFKGDLLEDCWDEWALAERDRLRAVAAGVLERLSEAAAGHDAIDAARRLVELDPFDERARRRLMTLHMNAGDRAHASSVYSDLVSTLEAELGVEPAPETVALHARLRDSPGKSRVEAAPLVGRERPMKRALESWRAADGGSASILLVTGEAGIGKSRLLEELRACAVLDGATVAATRCYEAQGRLVWGPVVEWLRSEPIRSRLRGFGDAQLTEISRLLPEVRAERGLAEPPTAPDLDRRFLYEALAHALLGDIGEPTVLLLDDLQWCDDDTLAFLRYFIRSAPDARLLIAGSARSEELEEAAELESLRTALHRDGVISEVELEPLEPDDVARLAELAGGEVDHEALYRETEGNPLFVVEMLRARRSETTAHGLPRRVQSVIRSRLDQLSREGRSLTEIAATIGRRFSVQDLEAAGAGDGESLAEALDELWRRRVIVESGADFDFSHDKIREVAYAGISPAHRRRLHRQVAAAMVKTRGAAGEASARLAAHYERADMAVEAVAAYREAATYSRSLFAVDDAVAALRHALTLLDRTPVGNERDSLELEILTELGAHLSTSTGYAEIQTRRIYQRASELSRRLVDAPRAPILRGLALEALVRCEFDRTIEFGEQLLVSKDPAAEVEGRYVIAVSRFWRGEFEHAHDDLEAAIAAYRPELSGLHTSQYGQDPRIVCMSRLALALWFLGDTGGAMSQAEDTIEAARELDHPPSTGYALSYTTWVAAEVEDADALSAWLEQGSAIWAGFFQPMTPLVSGWSRVVAGDAGGLDSIEEAVGKYRNGERVLHLTHALARLSAARLRCKDPAGALCAASEALQATSDHDQWYLESELLRLRGEATIAGGDPGGLSDIDRARDVAIAQGARSLVVRAERSGERLRNA